MKKILFITLFSLAFCFSGIAEEDVQTDAVQLSISKEQLAQVKRIHDFFVKDLGNDLEDYVFEIQESEVLNAYATLGKKIIVTTGLIKKLKTEAGLAFVIAHELGHVEQKHVLKSLFRNTIGSLIQVFFFREASTASQVYQGANYLHSRYYSRDKEKKADLFAVDLINKHYCKQSGKLEFFEEISKETQASKASEYFSTHPLPETRIDYLREEISNAGCVI